MITTRYAAWERIHEHGKDFFRGPTVVKVYFTNSKLREQPLSPKTLIEEYQISKSLEDLAPPPPLYDIHEGSGTYPRFPSRALTSKKLTNDMLLV